MLKNNMTSNNEQKNIELTYDLSSPEKAQHISGVAQSFKQFSQYIKGDGSKLSFGLGLVLFNSAADVAVPYLIAIAVDRYIATGNGQGLLTIILILIGIFLFTSLTSYLQGMLVGSVSQRTLFRLRESIFLKLQNLPIAFFAQNKAGDLMSRINGDAERLNQFLSESLARFLGGFFIIVGIAAFVFFINVKLALVMLSTTLVLVVFTRIMSPIIGRANKASLNTGGDFSATLQENLTNFRVVIAYSKRQYFRDYLERVNLSAYKANFKSSALKSLLEPFYDFAGGVAMIAVVGYGLHLFTLGEISIGVLVAFVSYTARFYSPLQYLASIIAEVQGARAAWSRVLAIFNMNNSLAVIESSAKVESSPARLELRDVSFGYEGGGLVIEDANLLFEAGKTYALVGPTGGGKSTLASLMARLYDPMKGTILLDGKDIRSLDPKERAASVSVILQDPIIFSGTVGDNIRYGNKELNEVDDIDLNTLLKKKGFEEVLLRFEQGLTTPVSSGGSGLSLGQKQLISFMRAILRQPKLLILDEATANIDTVTEALLNKSLEVLPKDTTKVIIAHRLNTIKEADEIMFVNGHHVTRAGNFDDAIRLIESSKRNS